MSHITKNLDNFLANEAQKGYMKSFIRHIEYLKEDNKMKTSVPESLANKTNLNNHYLDSPNIFPNKNHTPNDSDYHDINDKVDYKNCIDPLNEIMITTIMILLMIMIMTHLFVLRALL